MMRAQAIVEAAQNLQTGRFCGEVVSVSQNSVSANGPICRVGDICEVGESPNTTLAEVVSVGHQRLELMPLSALRRTRPGDPVTLSDAHSDCRVGEAFASRAVDAFGTAIDGLAPIIAPNRDRRSATNLLDKTIVEQRIHTGLRAIDGLLPIAKGQRIGVFAASGVGKTSLVEALSKRIKCDKIVLCLIGERGREVERFWKLHQPSKGVSPITIVAATSDESASVRVRAMRQALALCEYWRDQGEHVVFFVDSVTRLAMALREIGLAAGEPPALRSYTPNVFSKLPEFVERCGAIKGKGAITAIFTVLSETDEVDDPIVETMKSLLDGHIVLSRTLADRGHYPAIDIRSSVSRIADQILDKAALDAGAQFKKLASIYEDARPMVDAGLYQTGANADLDQAISLFPRMERFLAQDSDDVPDPQGADAMLQALMRGGIA